MKSARTRYTVAVVGATGVVGTEMLRVLHERRFPIRRLRLLASARSEGRRLPFNGSTCRVEPLTAKAFEGIDVALFSAGARMFEPIGGSAPKYTGQNVINALAAICAGAMLLEHVGEHAAAQRIEQAVMRVILKLKSLAASKMGFSTSEVGDLVVKALGSP